jgi:hypothetical protein
LILGRIAGERASNQIDRAAASDRDGTAGSKPTDAAFDSAVVGKDTVLQLKSTAGCDCTAVSASCNVS